MRIRFLFLVFISLSVLLSGCADSGSNTAGSTSDGTLGGTSVANIQEYFTAGPQTTTSTASTQALFKDNVLFKNDFEQNNSVDGVRLYFRYLDNTTAEAVYNIGGQDYNAIVNDMVYAGHNWIGIELERLYPVGSDVAQADMRDDRIALVNIKTGEIIVVENTVFQKCQDLETLEVLGNNQAYFLCENGAYSLNLENKEVTQVGSSKDDKFDDSYTVLFADGKGVYQPESENGRVRDIKLIDTDEVVESNDITSLNIKTFKNGSDDVFFIEDGKVYQLKLDGTNLTKEEVTLSDGSESIDTTAAGPVRNEDDATAKFINKQVLINGEAFYVYNVEENTITKTTWKNTDYAEIQKFIERNDDLEEHIFFGENGIAYVVDKAIKYIPYVENAEAKTVTLPSGTNVYEIDDITLIGNMLYFQLEDSRDKETYYKADVTQDTIEAEEYEGSKTIMKVIDLDITVSSDDESDNSGTGEDTGDTESGDNNGDTGTGEDTGDTGTGEDTGDTGTGEDTGDTGTGEDTGDTESGDNTDGTESGTSEGENTEGSSTTEDTATEESAETQAN